MAMGELKVGGKVVAEILSMDLRTGPLPPREMWIFSHYEAAWYAGWTNSSKRSHPQAPWMDAWWPDLDPNAIRGAEYSRVVITDNALRHWYDRRDSFRLDRIEHAKHILRQMLRVQPMLWIEL